jgi:molybdate/tungstate transport system substrate-binding protein
MKKSIVILLILSLLASVLSACTQSERTPVVVFCAGSLMTPFAAIETAYEAAHPDVDIQMECHGSIQVIRHVTELHEPIDVVATADAALIPMLMYGTNDPDSGLPYADWYVGFATNRLVVAYTPESAYADEITTENWYEILTRPDVRVGLSDPRFDALGYREMMLFQLAAGYYDVPGLFQQMFRDQFTASVNLNREADQSVTIRVPEVMETTDDAHIVLRGASLELVALLQSGDLDYAIEYESVARQQGLETISLPPELDLGEAEYNDYYQQVSVVLDYQRFATVTPSFVGEQIAYGITIPSNAPHADQAADYVAFILSDEGRAIMEANYHPLFDTIRMDGYDNIPSIIQAWLVP